MPFRLNPFACDARYCFVEGNFRYDAELQRGGEALPRMSADGVDVLEYNLDESQGGLEVGDYFTTTTNHLPLSRKCAEVIIAEFDIGPHECVPVRIKNAKGRIHVPDAVILSPLGRIDCLDWENSQLNKSKENPMVRILGKWRLRADRVPEDRDLFRVKGLIGYVFSDRLVDFIRRKKFKNFEFEPAELS
jgi:hypothetical protein